MWLLVAFLVVPLIEITLFIQIGSVIGLGWTLFTVVVTAVLGTWLVRTQGVMAIGQLKSSFNEMRDPTEPLVHGAMILFSGALLLTPGFFTDAVGFALLSPQVRSAVFKAVRSRINVQGFSAQTRQGHSTRPEQRDDIIDGDYHEVREDTRSPGEPSGWTKH